MPDEYTIREIADAMARLELLETTLEKYIAKDSMRDRDMHELLTAVKEIKTSVETLKTNTDGVVTTWKVVNGIQRFFKWVSGFSVVITVIAYLITKFKAELIKILG